MDTSPFFLKKKNKFSSRIEWDDFIWSEINTILELWYAFIRGLLGDRDEYVSQDGKWWWNCENEATATTTKNGWLVEAATAAMRLMCLTAMKYVDLMSWSSFSLSLSLYVSILWRCAHAELCCDASVSKYHTWNIALVGKKWRFLSTNWGKMRLFSRRLDATQSNEHFIQHACICVCGVAKGTTTTFETICMMF